MFIFFMVMSVAAVLVTVVVVVVMEVVVMMEAAVWVVGLVVTLVKLLRSMVTCEYGTVVVQICQTAIQSTTITYNYLQI